MKHNGGIDFVSKKSLHFFKQQAINLLHIYLYTHILQYEQRFSNIKIVSF